QILYLSSGTEDRVSHLRNLFIADRDSRALIVETYLGLGEGASLTNAVTEVIAAAGAEVEHYTLQEENPKGYHVAAIHAHQDRGSRYVARSGTLGARLSRTDLQVSLDAEGAECELNGLSLGRGRQHIDHRTR